MPEAVARTFWDRMWGAALLDVPTYEEVEHDPTATGQAAAVVAMAAAAQAIGASAAGPGRLLAAALGALLAWLAWAAVTYVIGDHLFGGTATWGERLLALAELDAGQPAGAEPLGAHPGAVTLEALRGGPVQGDP